MSDVVVHVAVNDTNSETKFVAAIEAFAQSRANDDDVLLDSAPEIMVKTIHSGEIVRKAVIFQDRHSAAEFLAFWRKENRVA